MLICILTFAIILSQRITQPNAIPITRTFKTQTRLDWLIAVRVDFLFSL